MKKKSVINEDVLVLNKNYLAVNVTKVQKAIIRISGKKNAATPVEWLGGTVYIPHSWEQWLALPCDPEKHLAIRTKNGLVRAPTIIVATSYDKIPTARVPLTTQSVRERDKDECQYTGEKLKPGEGNVDHVIPRKHGGQSKWENMVYCKKEINDLKGNRKNNEVIYKGKPLKLIRKPRPPLVKPRFVKINKRKDRPEWDLFLIHK